MELREDLAFALTAEGDSSPASVRGPVWPCVVVAAVAASFVM
jgi:hypothetical protein